VWAIASLEKNIRIRGRGSYTEDRQGDVLSTANTNIAVKTLHICQNMKHIPWSYVLCICRMPGLFVVEWEVAELLHGC
jgi:hypothetical protein